MVISVANISALSSTYAGAAKRAAITVKPWSLMLMFNACASHWLRLVQDKTQEALFASNCAPGVGRDILDVQLPVDEIDLWIGVEFLLDL